MVSVYWGCDKCVVGGVIGSGVCVLGVWQVCSGWSFLIERE